MRRFSFSTASRKRSRRFLPDLLGWSMQVVEVAEDVRRLVDQIEVGLAVELAEGGVGQFENVDVADDGVGHGLAQGQLDGLGGADVAGADRRGQDEDARLFGGHGWALVGVGTPYRNRELAPPPALRKV